MPALYELLTKTSRTFALAIPLLPEPTRSTVCLSYLLFRVADTLEDAGSWSRAARLEALAEWGQLLGAIDLARARTVKARWVAAGATSDESYRELLDDVPHVLSELSRLEPRTLRIVSKHAIRTVQGMRSTLERADPAGNVRIANLEQLRAYCYIVAGIVGELLTELFVHDSPGLERVKATLVDNQVAFGEGLQLVNILKDAAQDAREGRVYVPDSVPRAAVVELARTDLVCARRYIDALREGGAPPGFCAFTGLSQELAEASLVRLEEDGPGAKVSRADVLRMFARYRLAASAPALADHSAIAQSGK
jgi:farnesyl-diphosphate farnesyltransferase